MGHRADLDGYVEEKNSCPHYNSNPRAVQPIANRYNDYAIPDP